jgi:hypothetical protein
MNFNFLKIGNKHVAVVDSNISKKRIALGKIHAVLCCTDIPSETPAQKAMFSKREPSSLTDDQVNLIFDNLLKLVKGIRYSSRS